MCPFGPVTWVMSSGGEFPIICSREIPLSAKIQKNMEISTAVVVFGDVTLKNINFEILKILKFSFAIEIF